VMAAYDQFKGLSGRQTSGIMVSMAQFAVKRILGEFRLRRAILPLWTLP